MFTILVQLFTLNFISSAILNNAWKLRKQEKHGNYLSEMNKKKIKKVLPSWDLVGSE